MFWLGNLLIGVDPLRSSESILGGLSVLPIWKYCGSKSFLLFLVEMLPLPNDSLLEDLPIEPLLLLADIVSSLLSALPIKILWTTYYNFIFLFLRDRIVNSCLIFSLFFLIYAENLSNFPVVTSTCKKSPFWTNCNFLVPTK